MFEFWRWAAVSLLVDVDHVIIVKAIDKGKVGNSKRAINDGI